VYPTVSPPSTPTRVKNFVLGGIVESVNFFNISKKSQHYINIAYVKSDTPVHQNDFFNG